MRCRHLIVVLGDQLDQNSQVWDGFDSNQDVVWMAEVLEESLAVPSHKVRTTMFLSAMRHFAQWLQVRGFRCDYRRLTDSENTHSLASEFAHALQRWRPHAVIMVQAGEYRVQQLIEESLRQTSRAMRDSNTISQSIRLELRRDTHFFCAPHEFVEFASGRKEIRLEHFYRWIRKQHQILMEGDQPIGGQWNFDKDNRKSLGKRGPQNLIAPRSFPPDELTLEVMADVNRLLPDNPGNLSNFDWPVTAEQARWALDDFIRHRLAWFGDYQDAMWKSEPYLFHSRLSAAMNLKLLSPRVVVDEAIKAYLAGRASLNAVEGFVRQIVGWREYVRGVYWWLMPEYLTRNELQADRTLPEFYWTAETPMNCLSQTIRQTLDYGYAHHIQRLMVTGLYSLLVGVDPQEIHRWYLAVYLDAVEWVELPNTLGMSQYADGGIMGSKPYVASGKYIQRMSNYCQGCQFNPNLRTGPTACPITTLYWDFLDRHKERLAKNQRMGHQLRNLERVEASELEQIRTQAAAIRAGQFC